MGLPELPADRGDAQVTRVYTNPVFSGYMGDPFIWRYEREYFAVGTGSAETDVTEAERAASGLGTHFRIFPLLRSDDFVTWHNVTGALDAPGGRLGSTFWAPEVRFVDGTFYLYYSVGTGDAAHQIRVATSRNPQGPYEDTGQALVDSATNPFAIDPHPFQDDDGAWYLFYATDFLNTDEGARAGTALVVDPMVSLTQTAGQPITVLRAHYDWQRYQAGRLLYGQTWDWHTLEGPCVRKVEGRYYCFYSGGCWRTDGYGVDYAVSDTVLGPYSGAGAENGPRLLRSAPGHLLGPGHCSVIIGPDDETEFLVYHAWDTARTARRMCLDRLCWTPDGPRCDGPSWTPQTLNARVTWAERM